MSKPEALGPSSRTVIGDAPGNPSVGTGSPVTTVKKVYPWKKLLVPAGIVGAIYLAMKYKGHV